MLPVGDDNTARRTAPVVTFVQSDRDGHSRPLSRTGKAMPGTPAACIAAGPEQLVSVLGRYAQNHIGPTRMQPRLSQSRGRWTWR